MHIAKGGRRSKTERKAPNACRFSEVGNFLTRQNTYSINIETQILWILRSSTKGAFSYKEDTVHRILSNYLVPCSV